MFCVRKLIFHPNLRNVLQEEALVKIFPSASSSISPVPVITAHFSDRGADDRFSDGSYDESDLWDRLPSHGRHRNFPSNSSTLKSIQGKRRDGFNRPSNFHRKGNSYRDVYENDVFSDDYEVPDRGIRRTSKHNRSRDPYDEEDIFSSNSTFPDFQNQRRFGPSREVGSNLKAKQWKQEELPPLEKNFYIENKSVSDRLQSDVDEFYNSHNIQVIRGERPLPIFDFHEANFPESIDRQLQKNGCTKPTPIQSLGWPLALSGKNMVGIAQTGSGKTLGFILPALIHVKHQRQVAAGEGPVVLVLAPTRELAQQIKSVAVEYGRLLGIRSCSIFGGQSKLVQAKYLLEGPEIVIATPGRLLDFLEMDVINLNRTTYVVLDEADRMLDMGFEPQIRKVLSQIRPDRQQLMWSATWPKEIQNLAHEFLEDFTQVNIGSVDLMANPNIHQDVKVCERRDKFKLLVNELDENSEANGPQKTLIFAQTKTSADFITHKLRKLRFTALALHGDKSQLVRDKTLKSFRDGDTHILVATDVASRGLDVDDIKLVINFDYPNNTDDYIHRIGRTARASKSGRAVSYFTTEDASKADDLIKVLEDAKQEVPRELQILARLNSKNGKKDRWNPKGNYRRPGFDRRKTW